MSMDIGEMNPFLKGKISFCVVASKMSLLGVVSLVNVPGLSLVEQ